MDEARARDRTIAERALDRAAALRGRDRATQPPVFASRGRSALSAAGRGKRTSANRTRLRHDEADRRDSGSAGWRARTRRRLGDAACQGCARIGRHVSSGPGQKPLIKREREVLSLISEGVLQQTGRHANAHQPKDLQKPSRRGDAQALVRETRRTSSARRCCIRVRCSTARRALNCRGQPCDSVEIFHEAANTGRGPQRVDRDLGRARHDGDGPERRNA
ncbi:MAG: hypothetical protein JWP51_2974 [Bradyrhizobium sp.]|nr:hypothetical protein [Bradyrhizobium sp.]